MIELLIPESNDLHTVWDTGLSLVVSVASVLLLWRIVATRQLQTITFERLNLLERVLKPLINRISAWRYLLHGTTLIQQGYDKSNGQAFEIYAPDSRYVFVSSSKHIEELDKAPDTVLSLQAASKQMLQPKYTMHGFNWFDTRGTEGVGFVRALRTLLTGNLPQVLPDLGVIIKSRFAELHDSHPVIDGKTQSPVYPMITKLVVLSNAVSFFGKDLAKNEDFMISALAYIEETLLCAEVIRLVPVWTKPLIGGIIARRLTSHKTIFNALMPIAEQRVRERDQANLGQDVPKHADCIQWILETSPRQKPWTAKRVVHELMAIWFGSVHALSTTITFAVQDICLHPEYTEPLRKELHSQYKDFEQTGQGLPLLDSFIKESARLTPVESMSTRRYALQPFTFSDGTKLNVSDWACTPVQAIMQDPKQYPEPLQFHGFRFADPELFDHVGGSKVVQPTPSKLVSPSNAWHVWGTGRMVCPGRFYAVAVMKVILGQMLMNYDCELAKPDVRRYWAWRSTMLPRENTVVLFTPCK